MAHSKVRTFAQQKAALTRALKKSDPDKREQAVLEECRRVKEEWDTDEFGGYWPDDWARWQRALDDVYGWPTPVFEDV